MRHGRLPKIGVVTHSLEEGGGVATIACFLYDVLRRSGCYDPEVISLATSSTDACSVRVTAPTTWVRGPQVRHGEFGTVPYRHVGAILGELEFQRYKSRRLLNDILARYDLIQFVAGTSPIALAASEMSAPRLLWVASTVRADRKSRVSTAPLARRYWSELMTRAAEAAEIAALKRSSYVFALSDYTRCAIKPWVDPANLGTAFCGIDTRLYRPGRRANRDYILCVGRLDDPRKNVALLLRAYAELRKSGQRVPVLYLVGNVSRRAILNSIREYGLQDNVVIQGRMTNLELAEIYRNARLVVLSSDEEGLGMVLVEAMASGVPVVSTDCGGPASLIRHGVNGLLVPVGDAKALAEAMRTVLENPRRAAAMGDAGRQMAEQKLSIHAAGKVFLDKYSEILN